MLGDDISLPNNPLALYGDDDDDDKREGIIQLVVTEQGCTMQEIVYRRR